MDVVVNFLSQVSFVLTSLAYIIQNEKKNKTYLR